MKIRHILLTMTLCSMLPISAAEEKSEHTALGSQMESFNDAYKAFRKETDPAKGAALARDAQTAVAKALLETPESLTKLPDGAEKSKAAADYRKMMGQVYVSLCEVEEAFLSGKIEDVAKIVESLKAMKKEGHEKFAKDE